MAQKKVYGLILPSKNEQTKKKETPAAFNIFGDDDNSDEAEKTTGPVGPFGQTSSKTKLKQQSQMDIEKAMMEDPTVYEYDEIYDEMQASKPKVGRDRSEKEKKKDNKPRYIAGLLKAAEVRKKEGDRRNERKVQKEREAEGEKYADKESFVTSAYKKKMLEMQAEEEREKRQEELDALTDVTKQKDMSGFYRYLYRQTNDGTEDSKEEAKKAASESGVKQEISGGEVTIKEEPSSPLPRQTSTSSSPESPRQSDSPVRDEPKAEKDSPIQSQFVKKTTSTKRNVRQRRNDSSSDEASDKDKDVEANGRKEKDTGRSNRKHRRSPSRSRSRSHSDSSPGRREKRKKKSKNRKRELSRSSSRSPDNRKRNGEQLHSKKRRSSPSQSPSPDRLHAAKDKHRSSQQSPPGEFQKRSRAGPPSDPPGKMVGPQPALKITKPVDPSKKIYPHHNSPKDIAEARKRYYARKLERERGRAI